MEQTKKEKKKKKKKENLLPGHQSSTLQYSMKMKFIA